MDTVERRKPSLGRTAVVLLCLLLCLPVAGCGRKGEALSLPTAENVQKFTAQEYRGDTPVSMEVEWPYLYAYPGDTYFYQPKRNYWRQITEAADIPTRKESLLFRITDTAGQVTEAFLFGDDTYNYLELPGKGVWREESKNTSNRMPQDMKTYRNATFTACFVEAAANGQLSLSDGYNGAGKAVWIDITGEGVEGRWDRYIPDEWTAQRPEDVRYVIVAGLQSREFSGYWYNPGTGQSVGAAYNTAFSVVAYDLVTGKQETIEDGVSMFHGDVIRAFFADKG